MKITLVALSLLAPLVTQAADAPPETPPFLVCMARYVAAIPAQGPDGWGLQLANGSRVPLGDGRVRSLQERADTPTLRELFAPPYVAGPIAPPRGDPGRTRSEALMEATYGGSERAVSKALVPWRFHGHSLPVQPQALPAFEAVGARLEKLIAADPSLEPLFAKLGGTFNWRPIAGTHRRSSHAFGIALDLNPQLGDYWRDASPRRLGQPHNHVPESVVAAFEAEGFIWGGRWSHYDTMHFEYRPELLACASNLPSAEPSWERPWLAEAQGQMPKVEGDLLARFPTPPGFQRVALEPDSFGSFLRTLPMAPPGTPVVSYRGEPLYQDATGYFVAGVAALDTGLGDRQQCADSVIRLHAEWLWALGVRAQRYQTNSGTTLAFADYLDGVRVRPHGNQLISERSASRAPPTRAAFRAYLNEVFDWANTSSIRREGAPVTFADVAPGDYFVMEGKPWGHAVLVLDVARAADGRAALLLGEGAIPAESFHVIQQDSRTGPWFVLSPGQATLETPVWDPFPESALHRLPVPALPDD
jgi:hypothetical protein